jgi:TRAP-type C4-dicarboxylate transport system substrate-binding protein
MVTFLRLVLCAAALTAMAFASPTLAQDPVKLRIMGMPLSTGNILKNKEQPFFEKLGDNVGFPIEADYKPLDSTGIKEFEQLRIMRQGLFDMIALRLGQVSRDEPTILGLDLVGLSPDYETGRKVVDAYFDQVDARLQKQFQAKLLGVWPFGPQIVFCKPAIKSLADLKGLKVRILDGVMAKFVERIGGTPVTMAFGEVSQGLSLGTIDCAVTGPSSANSAGWPETATHVYPLGFQLAVQGYAMHLNAWNKLTPDQQAKMQAGIKKLTDDIWVYSKTLWDDAMNCNAGKQPCTTGKTYNLTTVPVTPADVELMKSAVTEISFPTWSEACDKVNAGCSAAWKKAVGPIIGMQ